ncbi:MAG: glycosyltransferase family A protein, partial [Oscillospiraceae bacterium]
QQFPKESTLVASKSLAHEYVEWLKDLVDPNASTYCFVRTCKVVAAHHSDASNEPDEPRPFLSVLTRTQGRRPEALNETILCLAGQTDTDFELLIVAHKLDKEQTELVESIIASQPEWLRKKIRLILVNYGNRTAPLNMGFSEARGQYVSVLDDDDIVFDNWVEEFHKLAIENPGKILHSFIFSQNWMTVETPAHIDALRATSSVSDIYCKKFDILSQLSINRCPTLGLAFPAYSFKHYGITFDENLSTTEDWDFLMRTVFLCGIADTEVATGIYRLWTNTENSATLHDKNEWEDNYRLIKQKFSTTVIALPKGYSEIFDSPSNANISTSFDNNFYHFEDARVYVDLGNGYNAADIVSVGQASSLDFMVECPKIAKFDAISSVRFDPMPNGCGMISDFKAVAVDIKGNETTYLIADITTNGNVYDKSIVFLKNDPQILIDLKSPQKLKNIKFDFSYSKVIPDEFIDDFAKNKFSKSLLYRILVRALGKIKRMFKK